MGFTDALKRSLGFEEDTSLHNKQQIIIEDQVPLLVTLECQIIMLQI